MGILSRLAPRLAAERAEARLRLIQAEKKAEILQSYDAARMGGRFSGWTRPQTSANTELQQALPFLRATARELVRNNPHAARAVRVLSAHIAGTGVRPRAIVATPDENARQAIHRVSRDQWDRFVENCDPGGQLDFYGQQRLLMRAVIEGGEALRIWTPISQDGRLFWRCEIAEGDRIDHLRNEVRNDGSRIVQGIEFDPLGRRVAYWLHSEHPGERYMPGGLRYDVKRVRSEYVDHVFEILRPGQVRGVSWMSPSATIMRDVDDLAEAEIVRKKLEACISMVVHNSHDDLDTGASVSPAKDDEGGQIKTSGGEPIERMVPGMILEARPGWSVDFHAPPASEGLVEHMRERLHAVASGIGLTYTQMTGDLTQANYSSMRGGELEFSRLVDTWQQDLMIMQSGRPAWRRVMFAARANGDLRLPVAPLAKWTPPKRPWVDPEKEVRAAVAEMQAGIRPPQDVIERTGRAPEEVLDEIAEWRDGVAARGLDLTPSFGGPSSAAPTGNDEETET